MNTMLEPFKSTNRPKPSSYDFKITGVLLPHETRSKDERFTRAKRKELRGFIDKGTWENICTSEVTENAHILCGIFVLAIKGEGTDEEIWQARLVAQGYRGKLKTSLEHDTETPWRHSIRVLVGPAAFRGFKLLSTGVSSTYQVWKPDETRLHEMYKRVPVESRRTTWSCGATAYRDLPVESWTVRQ